MSRTVSTTSLTHSSRAAIKVRQFATLLLIVAVLLLSVPPAAAGTAARSAHWHAASWASTFPSLTELLDATKRFFGVGRPVILPEERTERPQTFPAGPLPTRIEREARVSKLELSVPRQVTMQGGQTATLAARAMDDEGETIQGLPISWESSDQNVIFIRPNGRAIAGNPGKAQVRARAGNKQELIQITVIADARPSRDTVAANESASRLQEQSETDVMKPSVPTSANRSKRRAHRTTVPSAGLRPNPPDLPTGDVPSLFEPRNAVGSPPNRYFPSAPTPPVADRSGREMPGSDNFNFSVPVTDLPGRGLSVSLALAYNSSIWLKSGTSSNTLTFDVDKCWPAPGFRLGYGYIATQNGGTLLLVDPDGTRHELINDAPYPQPLKYITTDGTFIRVAGLPGLPTATYTDGTQISYGASSFSGTNTTYFPTKITDRHGNYITVNYPTDANGNQIGPRISSIFDTLGRSVVFKYDQNTGDLVTITAPGYANVQQSRQEVRFYYETITDFTNTAKFASTVTVNNRPSSIRVIKYVYFPGTQMGYRYNYSPYGMIRQIIQLRGMQVSTLLTNQIGQVTSDGQAAATTTYDYPATTPQPGLSSAPTFSHRTDDWAGRTSSVSVTTFEIGQTIKITAPDGTYRETSGSVFGLTDTTELKRTSPFGATTVFARTKLEWEADINGRNRRIKRVQSTVDANLANAKTKSVGYTYTDYNNIDEIIEYDFNTASNTSGPVLRRTKTTYVTDPSFPDRQAYINRGLVHLPTSVKVFAGTSSVPVSREDYQYDGATLLGYPHNGPDYIINYDESFDPYAPSQTICGWQLNNPGCEVGPSCPPSNHVPCCPAHWQCNQVSVYNLATAKRGNLTTITAYADAASGTGASVDSMTYDIAGNVITSTANCCLQRSYTYTSAYQFAYPETMTTGMGAPQQTNTALYDYNTGLPRTSTNENNQTTTLHYDPANLRLYETIRPDGGTTDIIHFGDLLFAAPDATHTYSAVMSITTLDAGRTVRSWEFADGRGNVARTFGENAGQGHVSARYAEYDVMGRLFRMSNPYSAVYGGATDVNPTGFWTTYAYDDLGRRRILTLQDNNTLQTTYAGVVTTVTDQAGKQRRQTLDALDRIVQLDEPDGTGALTQSTTFVYDALDNLVKTTQGTEQQRFFKYDSLSRLTHERQIEQDAPYQQTDATGNNYWSHKINYNADDLVTDSWDARGIQTHVTYDSLNRVSQITYSGETATTTTPTVNYTYDEPRAGFFNRGKLTTVTTAAGGGTLTPVPQTAQAFDYDRMGRVQSQRQSIGATAYTLGYSYNLLGQLQSESYPSGRVVSMNYDAAARLAGVSDAGQTYANAFAYSGHGGFASETWGNGAIHSMSYNNRLQIEQIKLAAGGVDKQVYDYKYGEVNVDTAALDTTKNTGQVAVVDGWIDGIKQWQQRYAYDKLGRLSTGKELNNDATGSLSWRVDYTYDRWGNRYQSAGQGGVPVTDNDIDKTRNRFLTVGSTLMIYDAAGNLTIDQKFRGMQFTYDANGRLRRSDSTSGFESSVYDGVGQRVQRFASLTNVTGQSIYDAFGRLVADYESGIWKRDFVHRGEGAVLLASVESSGGTRYVLTDHQGSTRLVTNQTGQITSRHDYKPYGEELGTGVMRTAQQGYSVSNNLRQRFALTERDTPNGLDHAWFRKYDSSAGKWTSQDPYQKSMKSADPQSFNRYAYVENDPINAIDPTGLSCIDYYYFYFQRPHGSTEPWVLTHVEYAFSVCTAPNGRTRRLVLPEGQRAPLTGRRLSSVAGNDLQRVWQKTFDDCISKRKSERERMKSNLLPQSIIDGGKSAVFFGVPTGAVQGARWGSTIGSGEGPLGTALGVGAGAVVGATTYGGSAFIGLSAKNLIKGIIWDLPSALAAHEADDKKECEQEADDAIARIAR